MSNSKPSRELRREQVADARVTLAKTVGVLSEAELAALQITPEWDGLDMLRHILFWNDTAIQSLADWAGSRAIEGEDNLDTLNHSQVRVRAGLGREALLAQLNAIYDRYDELLATASEAELNEPGVTAWGEHTTRLGLIGVVGHDEEHYEQIRVAIGRA